MSLLTHTSSTESIETFAGLSGAFTFVVELSFVVVLKLALKSTADELQEREAEFVLEAPSSCVSFSLLSLTFSESLSLSSSEESLLSLSVRLRFLEINNDLTDHFSPYSGILMRRWSIMYFIALSV